MSLLYLCVVLAGLAALLGFHRLLMGPRQADRVVALDVLFAVAVLLCVAAALITGRTAFLDIAIGLALVGFVGTLAWARLIDAGNVRGQDSGNQE
ncbi:MAG: monovalent cation/H+ antiporter complex subunit F [Candidatus Competibacteraceae bacterium]